MLSLGAIRQGGETAGHWAWKLYQCLERKINRPASLARYDDDREVLVSATVTPTTWQLLDRMELHEPARRHPDGTATISRWARAGVFLFGPNIRLVSGHYCLRFRCDAHHTRRPSRPVIGVEVIAQNRVHLRWRDFTAGELTGASGFVAFEITSELGAETGVDAPLEFRFLHLVNADLTIRAVDLCRMPAGTSSSTATDHWRLLGRLRPGWVSLLWRARSAGLELYRPKAIRLSWLSRRGPATWRCEPLLRLPKGQYRLELRCRLRGAFRPAEPALRLEVVSNRGITVVACVFSAKELAEGYAQTSFEVPEDLAVESGENGWLEFKISRFGNAALALHELDLRRLPPSAATNLPAAACRPAAIPARAKIVVVGNCQGGLIAEAFRRDDVLARRFATRHHYIDLPANLHEQGKRELADCDILLVQDIRDWANYPLRADVPSSCPIVMFPCVGFASPWPFDAFNGPDDHEARRRDFPNYEFEYLDGLLGRLRREIPDPEARFAAYKALAVKELIDYRRLQTFEERRLTGMDATFGGAIGAYILENFRKRRVFHTTAHPNGEIMGMMLRQIAAALGVKSRLRKMAPRDELTRLQVPIHPKVAQTLGVTWANETTSYLYRGERITWETYIRKYIGYYG